MKSYNYTIIPIPYHEQIYLFLSVSVIEMKSRKAGDKAKPNNVLKLNGSHLSLVCVCSRCLFNVVHIQHRLLSSHYRH